LIQYTILCSKLRTIFWGRAVSPPRPVPFPRPHFARCLWHLNPCIYGARCSVPSPSGPR